MKKFFLISSLFTTIIAHTQELYQIPSNTQSHVSSFENMNGVKGQGGKTNKTAKGNAFELIKAGETKTLLNVKGQALFNACGAQLANAAITSAADVLG